jgi:predicted esterase YcpF (UPF0227 family)
MSSAESSKAQIFKKFLETAYPDTQLIIPNILDKFSEAIPQLDKLVNNTDSKNRKFIGSSLGGFFATYHAELYKTKAAINIANKFIKNQGRLLVRKSGTEPKIRIMGESYNKDLLKKCVLIIKKTIY